MSEYPPEYKVRTVGVVEHSPEAKERGYQVWKETQDATEVALALSIPSSTIRSWCARYKWADRLAIEQTPGVTLSAETAAQLAKAQPTRSAAPASNLDLTEKQTKYTDTMGDVALRIAEHAASLEGKELVQQADKLLKADQIARKALKLEHQAPHTVVQIALLNTPADKPKAIDI